MALNNNQKRFIKEKVKILGSQEATNLFYKRSSLVCQYAQAHAEKIFPEKEKKK